MVMLVPRTILKRWHDFHWGCNNHPITSKELCLFVFNWALTNVETPTYPQHSSSSDILWSWLTLFNVETSTYPQHHSSSWILWFNSRISLGSTRKYTSRSMAIIRLSWAKDICLDDFGFHFCGRNCFVYNKLLQPHRSILDLTPVYNSQKSLGYNLIYIVQLITSSHNIHWKTKVANHGSDISSKRWFAFFKPHHFAVHV